MSTHLSLPSLFPSFSPLFLSLSVPPSLPSPSLPFLSLPRMAAEDREVLRKQLAYQTLPTASLSDAPLCQPIRRCPLPAYRTLHCASLSDAPLCQPIRRCPLSDAGCDGALMRQQPADTEVWNTPDSCESGHECVCVYHGVCVVV